MPSSLLPHQQDDRKQVENLEFSPIKDADEAYALEVASFPVDNSYTMEPLPTLIHQAPQLALGAYYTSEAITEDHSPKPQLVGLIVGSCVDDDRVTKESMAKHDPKGDFVSIRCVCVDADWRGKGVAKTMLLHYLQMLRQAKRNGANYRTAGLLSHTEVIPLYEKVGFTNLGKSPIVLGARDWYNMELPLNAVIAEP